MTAIDEAIDLPEVGQDLSLRDLVLETMQSFPDVYENQDLTSLIHAAMPQETMATYCRQALAIALPVIRAGFRNVTPCPMNEETPKPRSGKGAKPGWRQQSAASSWEAWKRQASLGNMPFWKCTTVEIAAYAESVISQGQATIANGRKYERLAKIGAERGYETGEDYPPDLLQEVLG